MSIKQILFLTFFLIFFAPLLVFFASSLNAGHGLSNSIRFVIEHCTTSKRNLLIIGLLGLVPATMQIGLLFLHKKFKSLETLDLKLAVTSYLLLFSIVCWSNLEFWPKYFVSMKYPGFPHGLELFIGPVVFGSASVVGTSLLFTLLHRK